jgi:putative restriction endonuclease
VQQTPLIIANITWNPDGWRNTYINRHAGHRYVREAPGHESLNFKFDKPIDKNGKIHGYIQWTNPPKKFSVGGVIIFYTRNLKTNKGEIVGIYGNADIIRPPIKISYPGFEKNILWANIKADERLSMLFPSPLSEKKCKQALNTKRLVPQVGFRLVEDQALVKTIICDEIIALKRSGIRYDELKKLVSIYEYVTGEPYKEGLQPGDEDIKEQEEILEILKKRKEITKELIAQGLKNLKPTDPEVVTFAGKTYKRDNKTIAELKILRDSKCQICDKYILKKNGDSYVEAAHITPKSRRGLETPDNILILCPNHHKEFDLGKKEIIKHTKDSIEFRLNDTDYRIKLNL